MTDSAICAAAEEHLESFFRRWSRLGPVGAAEKTAFLATTTSPRDFPRAKDLTREGARSDTLWILTQGIAVGTRPLPGGEQQHMALFVPGDLVDLEGFALKRSSMTVTGLSPIRAVGVNRPLLMKLVSQQPELAVTIWRLMAAQMLVAQEWLRGVGRRSARARTAHFLCEFYTRLSEAGMANSQECPFPLTQSELADVLGLSTVHVNRVLQQLRAENLVKFGVGQLTILNAIQLRHVGDFDAAYLQPTVERDDAPLSF